MLGTKGMVARFAFVELKEFSKGRVKGEHVTECLIICKAEHREGKKCSSL